MLRRQLRTLFGSGGSRFGSGSSATLTNAGNPFKFSSTSKTEMKTSHDPSQGGYERKDHPRDNRRRDNQRRRAPRDNNQGNTRPQQPPQQQLQPEPQQQMDVGQYPPQDYHQPQDYYAQYPNPPPQQQQQHHYHQPQGNMQGHRQPRGNRRNRAQAPRRKSKKDKKPDWMPTNAKCGEKSLTFSFPKRPSVAFAVRVLGPVVDGGQSFHSANFYPEDVDRLRNIKEKGITTSSPFPEDPERDTKYIRDVRIMPNGEGGADVTFIHKPPPKPKEGQQVGEEVDLKFTLSRPEWISFYHKIALRYTEGSKHHMAGLKWKTSLNEKQS